MPGFYAVTIHRIMPNDCHEATSAQAVAATGMVEKGMGLKYVKAAVSAVPDLVRRCRRPGGCTMLSPQQYHPSRTGGIPP
ncbi:hypothetical protein [Leptolyngbya iicbica]|uniref:Uncharacterized protein n=2 Tax=Cyanophyceae TaxID=3028117 RepID=A0A4Q7EGM6_9CYAN|nr:hypothetical protein [Leptolyngbya sp. LK]RZM82128.1 hypothetical protein DYY88_02395 [Leptolyngbya sp. LK]